MVKNLFLVLLLIFGFAFSININSCGSYTNTDGIINITNDLYSSSGNCLTINQNGISMTIYGNNKTVNGVGTGSGIEIIGSCVSCNHNIFDLNINNFSVGFWQYNSIAGSGSVNFYNVNMYNISSVAFSNFETENPLVLRNCSVSDSYSVFVSGGINTNSIFAVNSTFKNITKVISLEHYAPYGGSTFFYNNIFINITNLSEFSFWSSHTWSVSKDCTAGPNIIGGPCIGGNYWSDYTGVDADGDGIGDTPYLVGYIYDESGQIGEVYDYFPLVLPNNFEGDVIFTDPTPENNIDVINYVGFIINITTTNNSTITDGYAIINDEVYPCTLSEDNKSCYVLLTLEQLIYGETYNIIGYLNISGNIYQTNETRTFNYYGCGIVNRDNFLKYDLTSEIVYQCLTFNTSNVVFDGNGKKLSNFGNPIDMSFTYPVSNITIKNVIIENSDIAISSHSYFNENLSFINNTIINFASGGIACGSKNTKIENNTFIFYPENDYVFAALDLQDFSGIVAGNKFFYENGSNNVYGIYVGSLAEETFFYNNEFSNNILFSIFSTENAFIYNNKIYKIEIDELSENIFLNTTKDCTAGPNIIGGPCIGGNYWSDYTGVDADGDGIGDTPYTINNFIDYLPLINNYQPPQPPQEQQERKSSGKPIELSQMTYNNELTSQTKNLNEITCKNLIILMAASIFIFYLLKKFKVFK